MSTYEFKEAQGDKLIVTSRKEYSDTTYTSIQVMLDEDDRDEYYVILEPDDVRALITYLSSTLED